jgi:hypothetical protein
LNVGLKRKDLSRLGENGKQTFLTVLRDDEIHLLLAAKDVFFLWRQGFIIGAFERGPLPLRKGLWELSTGAWARVVNGAAIPVERAGLLGCGDGIGDVEAAGIAVVDVANRGKNIKPLFLGPPENVLVGNVDVSLPAAPSAALAGHSVLVIRTWT